MTTYNGSLLSQRTPENGFRFREDRVFFIPKVGLDWVPDTDLDIPDF